MPLNHRSWLYRKTRQISLAKQQMLPKVRPKSLYPCTWSRLLKTAWWQTRLKNQPSWSWLLRVYCWILLDSGWLDAKQWADPSSNALPLLKILIKKSIAFSTLAILQFCDEFRAMVTRGQATYNDHLSLQRTTGPPFRLVSSQSFYEPATRSRTSLCKPSSNWELKVFWKTLLQVECQKEKKSETLIIKKENKSAEDVRGDKVELSASSGHRFWEVKRKGDKGLFQVCTGSFHQSGMKTSSVLGSNANQQH